MTTSITQAFSDIDEVTSYVSEEWIANDGGLTMAASDVLALAAGAKKAIEEGNSKWVKWDDLFCGTSAEQDILEVVYNYFH
jgi:hypothetical protein